MTRTLEVFADITCPFTHVGLTLVRRRLADTDEPVEVRVRAWPLEWVNGAPLDVTAVRHKVAALDRQLGPDFFAGFDPVRWPQSTIPALNLAAAAYRRDAATGFAASLRLRHLLFHENLDLTDPAVLSECAMEFGLTADTAATDPDPQVVADYEEGRRRGVRGSPDFRVGADTFFCPSLDLGHDDTGELTAVIDTAGLEAMFDRLLAT